MESKQYTVVWEIQITASSKEEAAKEALAIQRDPKSNALVFRVFDDEGEDYDALLTIDLMTNVLNGEDLNAMRLV